MSITLKRVLVLCLALASIISAVPLGAVAATDWVPSNVKSVVFDPNYYAANNNDVATICGTTYDALYNHFLQYGAKEGRQGSPVFRASYYLANNGDLKAAFGTNYVNGINHFGQYGYNEPHRKVAKVENLGDSFEVKITASNSKVIGLSNADAAVETASATDNSQIWVFTRNSDETYTITNKETGKVLDVYGASAATGAKVHTYAGNGTPAQKWYIFKYSTGKYIIRARCAALCVLTVSGSKILSSTYTGASSQIFTFAQVETTTPEPEPTPTPTPEPEEPTPTPEPEEPTPEPEETTKPEGNPNENTALTSEFYARILGISSNKYIDLSGDNVVINSTKNSRSQVWHFKLNSDGTYTITNRSTGKVLDVYAAGTANGTNVQTYKSNGTNAQRWTLVDRGGHHYTFEPKNAPSKVLDIAANGTANGTNAQIYQYNGTNAQKFAILKITDAYAENTVWYSSKTITVEANKAFDLNYYNVQFGNNSVITDGTGIVWSSSAITVNAGNIITPKKGTYKMTAKSGSTTMSVTVKAVEKQAVLHQLCPDELMLGNSYVIKTKNDKLIVIDGGGVHFDDSGYLYSELQRISNKEVPEVEAWILSHLHDDHVTEFTLLVNDASKKVVINNVYINLPSKAFMNSSEKGKYSYLHDDVHAAYDKLFGAGAFNAINGKNVFEGDTVEIDGVILDFLIAVTDEEVETNINDTSLIFRATIEGQTVLFLGDANVYEGNRLLEKYGSELKSDMVQMAHHGQAGVAESVYKAILPTVCLWPSPAWVYDNWSNTLQTFEVRQWMANLGVKYHVIAGLHMNQALYFPVDYSKMTVVNCAP